MLIQWYPGHMHKASREIKAALEHVDLMIEIIDARIPFSSQNPALAKLRGDTPCIKVLSKCDLADDSRTQEWQEYLEREKGVKTLAVAMNQTDKIKQLTSLCHKLVPRLESRSKPLHALITGIPNVGKSTIINVLAGRTIAKTGDEPAVTKHQQRIDLGDGLVLFDTPGVLWGNIENQNSGYRLAATGAIKDTAFTHEDVASWTAEFLLRDYPEFVKARYQLETVPENETELLNIIGRKRGCLKSGGKINVDQVSKILIGELRTTILGKITLETPEMIEREMAELEIIRAEKAAKKLARKKRD
ncbi:MAG: ribosome biogenesis GTPase YlqF [Methylococcales bacterium]|nr:ribosome biogenesis GTPase YlqF [Methylococcales bacterium]